MKTSHLILATGLALTAASSALAQVIMVDFGSTTIGPTTAPDTTNSAYHVDTNNTTNTTWNLISNGDRSNLKFGDNTDSGVTLNLGRNSTTTLTAIDLASNATQNNSGPSITTGIYANTTSAGRDILHGFNGTDGIFRNLGAQFTGLAAGTYDVYVAARKTFQTSAHGERIYVGTSSSAGNFDFGAYDNETLTYAAGASVATSAWVDGENFVKFTVTLADGEALNIGIYGLTALGASDRASLNYIQIAATTIPEPSAAATLAGFGVLGLVGLSRRRRA